MLLSRLLLRGVPRTTLLRRPVRSLATSATLHATRSTKQSGPRNLRRPPVPALPLRGISPKKSIGATRATRPVAPRDQSHQEIEDAQHAPSRVEAVSAALKESAGNPENALNAPVHIPEDPHSVLKTDHPATSILANSSIVVQRQLEMMNVLMGFEQANKYVIMDGQGNHIGFLAEKENGFGGTMARQMFKTHRSFTTHVFDKHEKEILRFHRPFSWINSKIRVYDAINGADQPHTPTDALQGTSASSLINQTSAQISPLPLSSMRIIGEAQQQWAPLRRKYNLFLARDSSTDHDPNAPQLTSGDLPLSTSTSLAIPSPSTTDPTRHTFAQFAYVNEPWLSWDFTLLSADDRLLGSVNRNFAGFAREIFTDTGVYALRMDAASLAQEPKHLISHTAQQGEVAAPPTGMTLDQRAVMLATAVSIDFDYFSRHSGAVGGMGLPLPIWIPGGGGAAAEGAAAEGAVAEAGEVGAAGRTVGGVASSESAGAAVAGAGTMVGYEAMQGRRGQQQEEVWGEQSPWDESGRGGSGDGAPPSGGAGGGGGGDGGGDGFDFDSFF